MSLLPEIKNGKIVPDRHAFVPPPDKIRRSEEQNFEELQNLGHDEVAEDFSDSPFADKNKKE